MLEDGAAGVRWEFFDLTQLTEKALVDRRLSFLNGLAAEELIGGDALIFTASPPLPSQKTVLSCELGGPLTTV